MADEPERAFPADAELVALEEATKHLREMLCRPPAGLTTEEIEDVRMRRARELTLRARELEAIVEGRKKPRWRGTGDHPQTREHIIACDLCKRASSRETLEQLGIIGDGGCGGKELDCKSGNCATHGSPFGGKS